MSDVIEAAADASTGALLAAAVDGAPAAPTAAASAHATCLNCGASLGGPYCAACGQAAHIHRSLASVWHDFSHSVLHFEGKLWRTLPELALFPGRLTRRYIDGERAKFISPMALYLFTVFLMYAVFSFTGGARVGPDDAQVGQLAEVARVQPQSGTDSTPTDDGAFARGIRELGDNPSLMTYKIKTNGYKYSWLLVPLSLPFMWLLFPKRRDILLYDHAVFVAYSVSFMMLLVIAASLLRVAGVAASIATIVLQVLPPIHMYRQLRGAFGLSRPAAVVRLVFLLVAAGIVLTLFVALLFMVGALG